METQEQLKEQFQIEVKDAQSIIDKYVIAVLQKDWSGQETDLKFWVDSHFDNSPKELEVFLKFGLSPM